MHLLRDELSGEYSITELRSALLRDNTSYLTVQLDLVLQHSFDERSNSVSVVASKQHCPDYVVGCQGANLFFLIPLYLCSTSSILRCYGRHRHPVLQFRFQHPLGGIQHKQQSVY